MNEGRCLKKRFHLYAKQCGCVYWSLLSGMVQKQYYGNTTLVRAILQYECNQKHIGCARWASI